MPSLQHTEQKGGQVSYEMPRPPRRRPEISMAPLIDIVFLLLIFFMVTTVFPDDKGIVIEKPKVTAAQKIEDIKLTFSVDKHGAIYLDGQSVTAKDVRRLVSEKVKLSANVVVLLKVDKHATADVFMQVMDAAKQGGAQQLGIAGDVYQHS